MKLFNELFEVVSRLVLDNLQVKFGRYGKYNCDDYDCGVFNKNHKSFR
jgi:hypothetical protein